MLFGSEHGPDTARWHTPGLSRIAIWRRMAALIREEIGEDALWLGCGCPLWASVGYVDAMRIGRDIGVTWHGEYSAESLLRDQLTRNHAANVLWQADPDCILLRDRYHELNDEQVNSLAQFAANAGGVLMTSDHLGQLGPERQRLFADALRDHVVGCSYPQLGNGRSLIEQRVHHADGRVEDFAFNPTGSEDAVPPYAYRPA
jgi:alpha-galactosidase